jgi:hypothetical protein
MGRSVSALFFSVLRVTIVIFINITEVNCCCSYHLETWAINRHHRVSLKRRRIA